MLHARGREETMILGSEALAPMVRALLPKAEIIGRPRFSTLSYAGPDQAVAAAAALGDRRLFGRAGLCGGRDAAPDARRRGRGDGALLPADPQCAGRHVSGGRGRLPGRDGRDRHGPQHGRRPMSPSPAFEVRRPAAPAAEAAEMAQIAGRAGATSATARSDH
jgi:hypothetical protein